MQDLSKEIDKLEEFDNMLECLYSAAKSGHLDIGYCKVSCK